MKSEKKEDDYMWLLDAVEKYNMDDLEAKACNLSAMWLEQSRRAFPDYRHSTMKKGDPRKSLIFKIAYKLARETQGILENNEHILNLNLSSTSMQDERFRNVGNGNSNARILNYILQKNKNIKELSLHNTGLDDLGKNSNF